MSCPFCDPKLSPTGPPKGEGHLAVRFSEPPYDRLDVLATVCKDGEKILDCYEVEAPTRAWRFVYPPMPCACGSHSAEAYLDESGGFSVSIVAAKP